jgi:hypothetical protein
MWSLLQASSPIRAALHWRHENIGWNSICVDVVPETSSNVDFQVGRATGRIDATGLANLLAYEG